MPGKNVTYLKLVMSKYMNGNEICFLKKVILSF
jgi:hypothetical protein